MSDTIAALRQTLEQAQNDCRQNPVGDNKFTHFAARNALLVTRARVKWLTEVQGQLKVAWLEAPKAL